MTGKRFTMKGSTILENNEEITAWDCCDLLNELYEDKQLLIKEAKHQQGQKQRLVDYLQQYLNITEIREIMNKELEK